jgi:predicted metal-dependent HD superfamily phosphohydrolase
MAESELIKRARAVAEEVFQDKTFENRPFHNLEHTRDVVAAVQEIGPHSLLTDDELESATIAAWLHDIGYLQGAKDHETNAAERARALLNEWGASQKKQIEVAEAILSTKMPQHPQTMISKVLCDADLYHLSTKQCEYKSNKLRAEWQMVEHRDMKEEEWLQQNLAFMENHRYKTPYGQEVLQHGKKKNIKKIRKLLDALPNVQKEDDLEEEVIKLRSKLEKAKAQKPDRGIETMFRTTSSNHIMLSEMADNKANILITINSIILSVVVSVLVRKLEENPKLMVPTIMLVITCLTTTVFAILATRPNVTSGRFTRDDVKNKRTNLLFFGNFHNMKVNDYEWSMKEMMKDSEYLYGSMIKDIYFLGKVLGRKYRRLRVAYNIFMFGFVVSILSFVVAFMMSPKP